MTGKRQRNPACWGVATVRQIWSKLSAPWLARLLRERLVCRVLVAAAVVLLAARQFGIGLWPCTFAHVTGRPCPGCGMTRAFEAMARGDWAAMMSYHPFAPFLACVGVLVFVCAILPARPAGRVADAVQSVEQKTALPAVCMLILLCFGLLRMGGLCHKQNLDRLVPAVSAPRLLRSDR